MYFMLCRNASELCRIAASLLTGLLLRAQPHGCAENAKGIKLLGFVLVVTSKCLSGGKSAEIWRFLGILPTATVKVARLATGGHFPSPADGPKIPHSHTQWIKGWMEDFKLPAETMLKHPVFLQRNKSSGCIYQPILQCCLQRRERCTQAAALLQRRAGRAGVDWSNSWIALILQRRWQGELPVRHTSFSSELFVFSLLIVNDHEKLVGGQPGHPFSLLLSGIQRLWDNEINVRLSVQNNSTLQSGNANFLQYPWIAGGISWGIVSDLQGNWYYELTEENDYGIKLQPLK